MHEPVISHDSNQNNYFSLDDKLMGTSVIIMARNPENQTEVDDPVYHYTSPAGIKGILENRCFHFTDSNFLNDKSEIISALKVFESLLKSEQYIESLNSDMICELNKVYYNYNNQRNTLSRFFVFSASCDSDSLSMWKYYSKSKNYEGYNISFKPRWFQGILMQQNIRHTCGKVLYDKLELEIRYKIILDACNKFWAEYNDTSSHNHIIEYIIISAYQLGLFYKDSHFSDENEYRFVVNRSCDDIDDLDFRVVDGCFIPYIKVYHKLDESFGIFRIITIGPLQNYLLCEESLSLLLNKLHYSGNIGIVPSTVPVRY